jgi:predicted nucleic acid-binding protein
MIVIDTNVLSELMKPSALRSAEVFAWLRIQPAESVFTTTVSLAEILTGILLLPAGKRRQEMQAAAERVFSLAFGDRILPFDEVSARIYPELVTARQQRGRAIDPFDTQIAAIAKARGMAVATRNISDFDQSGVELIDPWTQGGA